MRVRSVPSLVGNLFRVEFEFEKEICWCLVCVCVEVRCVFSLTLVGSLVCIYFDFFWEVGLCFV